MEERKSFLFYRSFWSGGSKLKPRERLAFYDALAQYAFTGQETSLPHNAAICWEFAKPLIDSNNKKYADGSKGGRPQKTTGSDSLKNISEDKENEKDDCTLSELQQRTGFDPAEIKPLRAAGKIHLDTLNRIAAGLDVSPNSLLITATSPWKAYHGDYANQTCGFSDAFNVLADYSPYDLGPLFK